MDDSARTLSYLVSVELLAEEILADKAALVFLDRRRNESREAARELAKSGDNKFYFVVGATLVKGARGDVARLVDEDRNNIDVEIEALRVGIKRKVDRLRDLEMRPPAPGMSLRPLSEQERRALFY